MAERRELPMIACSLPASDQGTRLAEWRALAAKAIEVEWSDNGARLAFDGEMIDTARHLVEAEQACCPFFDFALAESLDGFTLSITAPPEAIELVSRLLLAK
jgi:hypothetical protein